ncbi:MAG: hypothetical protein Q8873_00355 [Bacillota bacterium]|nr:hypothetical protein [Bacillota bacterium]
MSKTEELLNTIETIKTNIVNRKCYFSSLQQTEYQKPLITQIECLDEIAAIVRRQSEGCEWCRSDAFEKAGLSIMFDRPKVYLTGGNSEIPNDEKFVFCPHCGRRLGQEAHDGR